MGDMIATCTSPQSRNRYVGVELGKGRNLDEVFNLTSAGAGQLSTMHNNAMPLATNEKWIVIDCG